MEHGVFSDHSLIPRLGDQRFAEAGDRAMRQILQAQTHRTWWCHIKPFKWHYKWVTGVITPISETNLGGGNSMIFYVHPYLGK